MVDNAVEGLAEQASHPGGRTPPGSVRTMWSKLARTVKCASLGAELDHRYGEVPVLRRALLRKRGERGPSES